MSPSIFNLRELRRRSKASFRTERSTDTSSDGSQGGGSGTEPSLTTGSLTPPSLAHSSDPALNLQLAKEASASVGQLVAVATGGRGGSSSSGDDTVVLPALGAALTVPRVRPPLQPYASTGSVSNRYSVSGMTGLGSPVTGRGGPVLPVSRYAPRLTNIQENGWVRCCPVSEVTGLGVL